MRKTEPPILTGKDSPRKVLGFHPNVFFLGLASLFNDIASEMVSNVLPLFLANVLGAKTAIIGLIEGVAESTGVMTRLGSGWLSDRTGKRKGLTVGGYALSTAAKPFLYIATAWGTVLGVRFFDRLGKGVRTSPRDALIADSTDAWERGRSFGLHRAMDTAGAVVGIALALLVVMATQSGGLTLSHSTFRWLVLGSLVPAVLAVLVTFRLVREVARAKPSAEVPPPSSAQASQPVLNASFVAFLGIMFVATLGKAGDAFMVLRGQSLGLSVAGILATLLLFNVVYSALSLPAGSLSDRLGRKGLLILGWATLALTYLGMAQASAVWQFVGLMALYGVYYAATEGVARTVVADIVPAEKRGIAYGAFHTVVGLATFPASLVAGVLWQVLGPEATFYFGASLNLLAVAGLLGFRPVRRVA